MDREQSELIEGEVIVNNDPPAGEDFESSHQLTPSHNGFHHKPANPDAIRADIEHTRAEMDATIDRLNARLQPRHLMDDVFRYFQDNSGAEPEGTSHRSLREAGQLAASKLKQNPVPATLIGTGLALLLFRNGGAAHQPGPSYDPYQASGSTEAGSISAQPAGEIRESVERPAAKPASQTRPALGEILATAPLALGLGALAAGLLTGLVMPGTRAEDQLGAVSDDQKNATRDIEKKPDEARDFGFGAGGSAYSSKIDRMWDRE